ncbi:MAG: uroporphyrinogen-III C-methyltransferase [Myxococcales bacterium]|nr:uroporphyrinogen-III C-methyltransferase [Myxococcales bacterium]
MLITLAGVRALARADVVLFDALVHPALLSHARADAERVFVGKRAGHEGIRQDEINALLLSYARKGRVVCRLKGGDPLLFGRGSEEAEFLRAHGIAYEVVPGVSSVLGATAYAGIPLTHREYSSSVSFITSSEHANKHESAHDWSKLATATQTLVLFMGVRRVRNEMQRLVDHGRSPSTPAAAIEWGTFARQRVVVGTIADLADRCEAEGLGPPALVVVGEVVTLRDALQWWDRQPLARTRIVVTRPRAQRAQLASMLAERAAEPLEWAAIEPCGADEPALRDAARRASEFDVVAFSSANGVEYFFRALADEGLDARAFGRAKVACIGAATADALRRFGLRADAVAKEAVGEGLVVAVRELLGAKVEGARVLVPRAARGRDIVVRALIDAGASVELVRAYDTRVDREGLAPLREALEEGSVDAITFASGSAVDAVFDTLGHDAAQLLSPVTIATIGPVTSEAVRARGGVVTCEAKAASDRGIVEALEEHFRSARDG